MKEVFGMIKSDPWSLIKMLWTASLGHLDGDQPARPRSRLLHACSVLRRLRWGQLTPRQENSRDLKFSDLFA
jgi:hypothetical protein